MDQFRNGELVFDVLDAGPEDGPVVVLLHGFPQFADSWSKVSAPLVAQGYRCVAPNQRGYSPGARPPGRRAYRLPELVGDVRALIDELDAERVHVVGHDWGAAVAWGVAAALPERVASLTAVSVPHPAAFLRALGTSRQVLASWYMFAFQLPLAPELTMLGRHGSDTERFAQFLRRSGQSAGAAARDGRAMADSGALRYALNWYRAMLLGDPRALRRPVGAPTLFVWSDGDVAIRREACERCGDWVSGPYRFEVLPGVSHWIPDEQPERLAELIGQQLTAYPA